MSIDKPKGYEEYLGEYRACLFSSGIPIMWGFPIIKRVNDDEKWRELWKFGDLECSYPDWFLITKKLTLKEAEETYGNISKIITGKQGGLREVVFTKDSDTKISTKDFSSEDKVELKRLIEINPKLIKVDPY